MVDQLHSVHLKRYLKGSGHCSVRVFYLKYEGFNDGIWTLIGHQSYGRPIEYSVVVLDDSILGEARG